MKVDLLYLAKDRIEYTKESFTRLLENTNWDHVRRLFVVDDGSGSASAKWLQVTADHAPVKTEFHRTHYGSPVAVMLYYLDRREEEFFAKIDNDIVIPPGWLEAMLSVIERYPDLDLLGMEGGRSRKPIDGWDGRYGINKDCSHIGGVGLIRGTAIRRARRPIPNGRFGWTENQHKVPYKRAWIKPDLQMVELDKLPFDPWMGYSKSYVEQGIQRDWENYPREMTWYWECFYGKQDL